MAKILLVTQTFQLAIRELEIITCGRKNILSISINILNTTCFLKSA